MFGARDIFGWRAGFGQAVVASLAAVFAIAVASRFGVNMAVMLAALPLVAYLTLQQPFILALVFTGFAYFRIHEAYPFLLPYRLVGLTGAAVVAGLVWRTFIYQPPPRGPSRDMKLLLLACAMLAIVFGAAAGRMPIGMPIGLALTLIAITAFSGALLLWRQFIGGSDKIGWPPEMKYFAWFFIFVSMTALVSKFPTVSVSYWLSVYWKIGLVTMALAWLGQTERDFGAALYIILISGALIAAVAIHNGIYGIDLVEGTRVTIGRNVYGDPDALTKSTTSTKSVLGDPNDLAMVLLFGLSFSIAMIYYYSSRTMLLLGCIALPMILLAIIYTQSRGGMLGVLAVFGVIGLHVIKNRALLLICGALGAMALFVAMGIGDRQAAAVDDSGVDVSSMGRLYAWMAAINMVIAHPIEGVGMQAFIEAHLTGYAFLLTGYNKAVHSTWFGVLGETGLVGMYLFVAMFVSACLSTLHCLRSLERLNADRRLSALALSLLAGFAGFAVAGAFLTHGFTWPLYMQVGLSIALWRRVRALELAQAAAAPTGDATDPPATRRPPIGRPGGLAPALS